MPQPPTNAMANLTMQQDDSGWDDEGDGWGDDCDICPGANGPVNASQVPNPDQGFIYDTNNDGINDSCFPPSFSSVNN